ncbi:hypothetical protein [uncultured Paraglaciecola sp.]|uniref:hypothetical protein n=1 Tax=uncultured Paraglaciecola sp. TaxID=1765024 RepID=UPI00260AB4BC|nr:hypothetical protein [uncultured Paraglaciecola sp.]
MINWIKAKIGLVLIVINWLSLIAIFLPFIVFTKLYDLKTTPEYSWFRQIFLAHDYFVNVILGGTHNTYISSLLGHLHKTKSKSGTLVALAVNKIFYIADGQVNHCIKSMKKTDRYDFSARRGLGGTVAYWLSLYATFSFLSWLFG